MGPTTLFEPFPREALEGSIPARFEAIVRRHPDRLAVKTKTQALTYAALNRHANRVARAILARGGRDEEPVALLMETDAPVVTAILGVLKAGRIYVPVDPAFPRTRIRAMLEDARAGLIVTNDVNAPLAREVAPGALASVNVDALDPGRSAENPDLQVSPDAVAYILYTSGSTGEPKGVFQNHRNLLHATMAHTNRMHLRADDRVTLLYSCSVNGSIRCIFGALLNGASLFPFDVQAEGLAALAPWLRREGITVYQSVPSVFRGLAGTLAAGEILPALRLVYVGGEPAYAGDLDLYRTHCRADCLFVNGWGPTEATVGLLHFLDKQTPVARPVVPLGFPVDDTDVLLIAENGDGGTFGEIAIRSAYLGLGYWGKPDLTRVAFLPDPDGGARRIYRTGDLGRRLSDGSIEFVGRKDSQVKIRGFRIELGEVEAMLAAHPAVRESIVVAREDTPGDQRLVGYVVCRDGPRPTPSEFRAFLGERLPDHMVPSTFVALDAFPRTPTGKVDRRALPALDPSRAAAHLAKPRDAMERELASLWEEVLGTGPIGIDENFFDLGGHSLLAAQLFAKIAKRYGRHLPLATLFHTPTVERLAGALRQDGSSHGDSALVPIQPGGPRPPLFCVHQHTGHLFCYQGLARHLGPDQPVYGLAPRGLDGTQAVQTRIEEIAAEYVRAIRAVQPGGPYHLAGYCFGGIIAFEMARQLAAQGQAVGLVALIEATWTGRGHPLRRAALRVRRRLAFEREQLALQTAPERVGYVLARGLNAVQERGTRILAGITARGARGDEDIPLVDGAIRRVEAAHREALRRYVPQAYPGRLALFRPARHHGDPYWGWGPLAARGVEVVEIPATRPTLVDEPDVQALAAGVHQHLAAFGRRADP